MWKHLQHFRLSRGVVRQAFVPKHHPPCRLHVVPPLENPPRVLDSGAVVLGHDCILFVKQPQKNYSLSGGLISCLRRRYAANAAATATSQSSMPSLSHARSVFEFKFELMVRPRDAFVPLGTVVSDQDFSDDLLLRFGPYL